ncbi:hypothetical protein SDC9_184306 [bioreactor metagenome]|uniref:Uncharacterized protein n=1 Tax=bioreactor metagenome TaxID=1076179 RepID=A0A645HCN5_9ZZZZ
MRVRVVAFEAEILEAEGEDVPHLGIDPHCRQGAGLARQLQAGLFEMVGVEVGVAEGMDEVTRAIAADLRQHHRQQRVGGDVEGHAEEDVGAALVELAGQLAVGDVELEQAVAGRQRHLVDVAGVPGGNDVAARIRVVLQAVHELRDLVDQAAVRGFPAPPLLAVDRAEVAVLVGPFVPDADPVLLQPANV